jgi:hypothetical protein
VPGSLFNSDPGAHFIGLIRQREDQDPSGRMMTAARIEIDPIMCYFLFNPI